MRYRIHYPITGKPDLVFTKSKTAVFVHGCFWHQHGCKNTVIPKTNTDFWKNKLEKNLLRDQIVQKSLRSDGWKAFIAWECEIERDVASVAERLSRIAA